MTIRIITLILWLIAGILNLLSPEITKLNYFLCWSILILHILFRVFELSKEG